MELNKEERKERSWHSKRKQLKSYKETRICEREDNVDGGRIEEKKDLDICLKRGRK